MVSGHARSRRDDQASPRRADAERNMNAILAAAATCLARNPEASMTEIAQRAGVGRITLYGHFSSREALLSELMRRTLAGVAALLDGVDLDAGPADQVLFGFLRSSWQLLDRHVSMLSAVRHQLPDSEVRDHHADILTAMERLVIRGQREGSFRDDLPSGWLVTTIYKLIHAAAEYVEQGQFSPEQAIDALEATLAAALRSNTPQGE
jgi:AcrR family transcriptional regulator